MSHFKSVKKALLHLLAVERVASVYAIGKNEETINLEDHLKSFEKRLSKMLKVSGETEKKDKKWQDGRKMDGRN